MVSCDNSLSSSTWPLMKRDDMESEMLLEEAMALAPGFMQFVDIMGQQVFLHRSTSWLMM